MSGIEAVQYQGPEQQQERKAQDMRSAAKEHPLCERCLDEGRLTLMDEVHHIVPGIKGRNE